jgi:glucose-1-phosphate adenylyltransferase
MLQHNPKLVIVFGADHIYRMDLRQMIDFHLEKDAHVTVAARPVPVKQASSFGIIKTDNDNRIIGFQEKPKKPASMPNDPNRAYASMGNYIFSTNVLLEALAKTQRKKQHDFGAHVIPGLVRSGRLFAYDFESNIIPDTRDYEESGYWRDVGTIPAFFDAHMDMLGKNPAFEIDNESWPIHPSGYEGPAAKVLQGDIRNSIIAEGGLIQRARIRNSVIRTNVLIEDGVSVEDSIIMDQVVLKKGCKLKRVIVDKKNVIGEKEQIGFDSEKDRFRCHIDSSGIAVVPRGGKLIKGSK